MRRQVSQRPLSFKSGSALVDRIEQLSDPGFRWTAMNVVPDTGTPLDEVTLYYRNPLNAIRALLNRPDLKKDIEFTPRRVWENADRKERLYSEIFTGEWAWRTQVCMLPQV